jgi:hypothetical protein
MSSAWSEVLSTAPIVKKILQVGLTQTLLFVYIRISLLKTDE